MPSKTSLYLPRPGGDIVRDCPGAKCTVLESYTYFAHDLVVLQHAPADVDAVIVPVCPGHLLVDVGVHARHGDCVSALALQHTSRMWM